MKQLSDCSGFDWIPHPLRPISLLRLFRGGPDNWLGRWSIGKSFAPHVFEIGQSAVNRMNFLPLRHLKQIISFSFNVISVRVTNYMQTQKIVLLECHLLIAGLINYWHQFLGPFNGSCFRGLEANHLVAVIIAILLLCSSARCATYRCLNLDQKCSFSISL